MAVALLVSAWIEIESLARQIKRIGVALLVSAWIEIHTECLTLSYNQCRTPRECVD